MLMFAMQSVCCSNQFSPVWLKSFSLNFCFVCSDASQILKDFGSSRQRCFCFVFFCWFLFFIFLVDISRSGPLLVRRVETTQIWWEWGLGNRSGWCLQIKAKNSLLLLIGNHIFINKASVNKLVSVYKLEKKKSLYKGY